jgi:RNA polymerase sigma-70 factor (ECF subfamily)
MTEDARQADAQIIERLRGGDLTAFEEIYRQHGSRIYNLAWRMLGDAADAEDAMQEIFLLAFRKVGGFKGESAFGTWLYRLAMNLCVDRLRSRTNRNDRRTEPLETAPVDALVTAASGELAVGRIDLERAIAQLPEGCRAAFLLHDVEGFEHQEVGGILGISEGTSKSQVHKARLRIREFLARRASGGLRLARPAEPQARRP